MRRGGLSPRTACGGLMAHGGAQAPANANAAQSADARAAQRADAAAMIQLELDDTDKKQFAELQQAMGQAQQEQSLVVQKLRAREIAEKRAPT